ncbi:hypothetical protein [Streptomyces sp. NBC_01462]|uniref:hypothetical protein n=1 Tax=Streptomyces sp. NBC_01462 TaxID=2903876 RepID=UPI002E311AB1|nr:hypothetical protein [Streptomyces sp. NBC_01462]
MHLAYSDPQGWLRHYIKRNQVPEKAVGKTGYVYALAVHGPVSYVKVGSTAGPRARFEALRSEAHRFGSTVIQAWLSPAHPDYKITEAWTLAACRAISPSATPRSEYFPELDFASARREGVKAVLGIRDHPRVSTTTRAAGLHEPMPVAVQCRLAPNTFDIDFQRRNYFAQGSRRSRFRRRNVPAQVFSADAFRRTIEELVQPRAAVIDLSSHRSPRCVNRTSAV